ncbi:MAG: protein kinase [Ignavibacteriaceae bacterium]|jgi:serine/threonine-protein kinase|nr:protein kinase [Ignavibacteriaceae bacterium]
MIGSLIENYKIVSILGEGGMGIVYKAFDIKLERFVALKVLNQTGALNTNFVERFKREAKNQAKLNHRNIVSVYGFTEQNGILGIVMEFVEGETLEKLITRKNKLDTKEALQILQQMLDGVGHAHSKSFIHRDIKPSNIILNKEGVVKIMDFGISKALFDKGITKTGTKIGTLLYMSPEQIRAEDPTKQSDIYSIGITLYEMLAGKTPFDKGTEYEIMEAHLKKTPPRVSINSSAIPPELDRIVFKALDKTIYKRYKNCEEFSEDVDQVLQKIEKSSVEKPEKVKTKQKTVEPNKEDKMRKVKIAFFAIPVLAVLIFIAYFIFNAIAAYWPGLTSKPVNPADTTAHYNTRLLVTSSVNWLRMNSETKNNLNGISFPSDDFGFACGEKGTILKSSNYGADWVEVLPILDSLITFTDIKFLSSNLGLVVSDDGRIFRTEDGGNSWQNILQLNGENFFRIYENRGASFVCGAKGTILKSNNGGYTFRRVNSNTSNLLFNLFFVDGSTGFAVGWNGTFLKTTDQGENWVSQNRFTDTYLRDVFFVDKSNGIVIAGGGEIFKTDDGGSKWEKVSSGLVSGLLSISFTNKTNGFISCNKGEILVTKDGGINWELSNSGGFTALNRLTITPSKKVFAAGVFGSIFSSK